MSRNADTRTSSRTTPKTAPKGAHHASGHDVLDLLSEDHKNVRKMFDQFEKMKESEKADGEMKQSLIEHACAELTIHAQVEEEIFYPAMRNAIDDMAMLDEAEVEHAAAKQLITELSSMQPDDALYDAKFTVLGEYIKHHIDEEEKEMFKKARKSDADLMTLADQVQHRKDELREEMGISPMDEEGGKKASRMTKGKQVH
ncbi:hemerythrin domain-containing protein [Noviherbaspirillum cavernae]|uniref:Hemerythrin domain-containing protein n=1 Tax=Noviherbaspirillum cavernae TaxID=2320862 RepID=A0A418X2M6_9BURK|nr:hemerythrin domain-containing protein [Noviherbaspirillum cavernae]RJG06718.1 hemerythrin domain-containing protein [Noviherbaspirillum cavernae]